MFNRVAFIGLGLIGGSMAKRIKEIFPETVITGTAKSQLTIDYALQNNIISEGSSELKKVVRDADLVIVATPIELIVPTIKKIAKLVSERTIIVDVASTKGQICDQLKKYSSKFIGGHPMAGTEKTGIINSAANILHNALFALTPYKQTPKLKLQKLKDFIEKLGMRCKITDPQTHDEAVAGISHLPYFVAAALLLNADTQDKKELAATGFKSTTRVGESDPQWGLEIASTNKPAILKELNSLQKNLNILKKYISTGNKKQLLKILKNARNIRRSIYP